MRAVQCVAPGEARFVEAPKPGVRPGHALVRTGLVSLCGSDVHMVYHADPRHYPFGPGTSGHEMVGMIEEIDAPTSGLRAGDLTLTLVPQHQAMAEYYLAPVEQILPLPPGPPVEHLLMGQQLGTVIFAAQRLPNLVGKDVVVIGQGSAGLHFDVVCRRMGAARVIGIDIVGTRVAAGAHFGATHSLDGGEEDPVAAVERITAGRLADVVVEAAGEVESINLAARLVKTGGHVLFFGIPRAVEFRFDFWELFRKYCHTTSIAGAPYEPGCGSFRAALGLIERGEVDVSRLLTHRMAFEQVLDAYELARTRTDGAIKIVLEMPGYREVVTRGERPREPR